MRQAGREDGIDLDRRKGPRLGSETPRQRAAAGPQLDDGVVRRRPEALEQGFDRPAVAQEMLPVAPSHRRGAV